MNYCVQIRDCASSLQIEGGAHSRGVLIKKAFLKEIRYSDNRSLFIFYIHFHISIFYTLRPFSNAKNLNLQTAAHKTN